MACTTPTSSPSPSDPWRFPRVLHVPSRQGRKPVSIPDITQFTEITRRLFGVDCWAPTEVYRCSTYNELFLLRLDTPEGSLLPKKVLARVSRDAKSRSDISLESEVATMVYVRQRCGATVPVPTVYGYCPTRHNVIGQPFSIVSFAEGVDMQGPPWEDLPLETKLIAVRDFANIVNQLSRLNFKAIGSIHFKFAEGLKWTNPIDFVLGPVSWRKQESAARAAAFSRDRGPWKTTGQWLRAAVDDEVQFIEQLPELAQETSTRKGGRERWVKAIDALPRVRDRVPDSTRDDPYDQCASGPFVLGHMDLNPGNIIFCPKGPNAGKIVSIIDWEISMTVPLWSLVCYPLWFDRVSAGVARDPNEAQYFKDAYIRELQKRAEEAFVLHVVQNKQYEARRRLAEIATLPWDAVEDMERWLENNPRRR